MIPDYRTRSDSFKQSGIQLQKKYDRLGVVRLGGFLLLIVCILLAWRESTWWVGLLVTGGGIFAFAQLVRWHGRIQAAAHHQDRLSTINNDESLAQETKFENFEEGNSFIDPLHPYSYDLDIFGPHSIFQMFNRAQTSIGQTRLAEWLQQPSITTDILKRQEAAKELSGMLEWQHNLRAFGAAISEEKGQIKRLNDWLKEAPLVEGNMLRKSMLLLAPILFIVSMYLWATVWPWFIAFLLLIPAGWVLKKSLEDIQHLHQQTGKAAKTLQNYAQLIEQIEGADFKSELLKELQGNFVSNQNSSASKAIKKLAYRLSQLDVRYNVFVIFLEISVVWDLQQAWRLDKWKAAHSAALPSWFESLATFEALISIGNLHLNHPEWNFPIITQENKMEGRELGHPLLPAKNCVTNEIMMPTQGHMHLITGSNMAGKSTWLRTVATNMVLAYCGAPCRAAHFSLPQMQVYTSMRTQDALHESTSSFYAELKRLKFIIDAVENPELTDGRPVFFLLDEILKGTNSRDRHTGSKALIRQLIASAGAGLIATHDLELGVLEAEANGRIENWAIEVDIQNNELFFDYKTKRGVSQSFNATLLMQRMGIKI